MQEVKLAHDFQGSRRDNLTKRWNLPAQNKNFTGRENLLDQISERLSSSKPLVISALHGLGGVGKTQLVTEYAYRNENKYERVLWITSESTDQIEAAYLSLGQDLQIIPEKTPPAQAIQIVKGWLTHHPRNLVIFDNAPDYQSVENYVLSSGADVLITSRHTEWPEKGIEVDVFSLEESILYFKKIVGERGFDTPEKIKELATELGRLPLALAQAAAYIRENKISIQTYIDLYQEKKAYLLSLSVLPEGDRHAALYVTWDVTMEKIAETSSLAPALLKVCSYLHSEKIPRLILASFCDDEKVNPERKEFFEEARGCLRNYSMVSVDERDDSVGVHTLVQEMTYLKMDAEQQAQYLNWAYYFSLNCFPHGSEKAQLEEINIKRILLPHFEVLLQKIRDNRLLETLLYMMQDTYGFLGNSTKRLEVLTLLIKLREQRFGADELIMAETLECLAATYFDLGKTTDSCASFEQALAIRQKRCSSEDPALAGALINLGGIYTALGNLTKAYQFLMRGFSGLKSNHKPSSIALLLNLGHVLCDCGEPEKARTLLEQALVIVEDNYGVKHPYLAIILGGLAEAYGKLKHIRKGCELLERAVKINEDYYGCDHPSTARSLKGLGGILNELGDKSKGLALLQRTLAIEEKHFGYEHPEISITLCNISNCYGDLGKKDEQYRSAKRALVIAETFFGPHHFRIVNALNCLAIACGVMNELNMQRELWERALSITVSHYGPEHLEAAIILLNLGVWYRVSHDLSESCQKLERAAEIMLKSYGRKHPLFGRVSYNLALVYELLNKMTEAYQVAYVAWHTLHNCEDVGPENLVTQAALDAVHRLKLRSEAAHHAHTGDKFMQEIKPSVSVANERQLYLAKRWNLPPRNTNFTGREILLDQIADRLSSSKPLVISALHGLGGVGKTQLVTEYAYRNEKKYERILWIPAESIDQIERAYLALGHDLGIISEATPSAEPIQTVKNWLANNPRNLLIFDNAPDYQTVENYVLPSGADVLITSRHTEWPEKGIEVDVFSLHESILYFKKIVGERENDTKEKIEELAEELGRLPLALAQATAYIRENKISIQAYIDLYQEKKAYLLSLSVLPEGDSHAAVYVTWDITMERIAQESVLAPVILNVCSYLHSEKIPSLLLQPFCEEEKYNPGKKELLEEASGSLRNYSMINMDNQDSTVSVHRVVQEVTRLKLSEESRAHYLDVICEVSARVFPYGEETQVKDIILKRSLLPHLESLLAMAGKDEVKVLDLMEGIQEGYAVLRLAQKQCVLLERKLEILRKHSVVDYLALVATMTNLAVAYGDAGDTEKKFQFLNATLRLLKEHGAEKSLHYGKVLANLGNVYLDLGRPQDAQRCYENALTIFRSTSGHVRTGVTLNALANVYGDLGSMRRKVELLQEALPLIEKDFGTDHPEYARALGNLGNAHMVMGEYEMARDLQEKAVACKEVIYGREHPDVAKTLSNLALVYGHLNNPQKKLELLERALSVYEKCLGPTHLETGRTLVNLANVKGVLGEVEVKLQLLLRALKIYEAHYDPQNPEVAKLLVGLGNAYGQLGDTRKQRELQMRALHISTAHFGPNHPEVAMALFNLGIAYLQESEFLPAFNHAYRASQILFQHPDAGPRHQLFQKTQMLLSKIISGTRGYLDENPQDYKLHLWIANFFLSQNQLDESIHHYQAAMEFLEGDEAAIASHNLACLYHVKGNVESADQFFQVALVYRPVASTYADYGLFLYKQGHFQEAAENLLKIFSVVEDKTGLSYGQLERVRLDEFLQKEIQQHGDLSVKPIIMAYYWIIRCYQRLSEQAECENYLIKFRKTVEISAEPLCWRLLSYTYEYLGRANEAEECREMLSAIEFSKQMSDAEAVAQFGLHPSPPQPLKREKLEESQEKLTCKK